MNFQVSESLQHLLRAHWPPSLRIVADVLLLIVYSAVAIYFVGRYARFRKLPSLGIALLPAGWILIGIRGMTGGPIPVTIKLLGAAAGILLLASVLMADRRDG